MQHPSVTPNEHDRPVAGERYRHIKSGALLEVLTAGAQVITMLVIDPANHHLLKKGRKEKTSPARLRDAFIKL